MLHHASWFMQRMHAHRLRPYSTVPNPRKIYAPADYYYVIFSIWQGHPSVQYDISGAPRRPTVIRQDFEELGAFKLF